METIDLDLESILAWTRDKLTEELPPWAWYDYMKLQEAVTTVLKSRGIKTENLPVSAERLDMRLRLVDSTYLPDTAQQLKPVDDLSLPM